MSNLIWTLYGLVALLLAYVMLLRRGFHTEFTVVAALAALFVVWNWKNVVRRSHGQRVEKRALSDLGALLRRAGNGWLEQGVKLASGGDADGLVVLDGTRFNLEIKSVQSVARVSKAHAHQAGKAGQQLRSIPVIWLPDAAATSGRFWFLGRSTQVEGVEVVCGDASTLLKRLHRIKPN